MNAFEKFLGNIHPVELEYFNEGTDRYVREIVQSFHQNLCQDKQLFDCVIEHYQINAQLDNVPPLPARFSRIEYKSQVNLKNVEEAFKNHCLITKQMQSERENEESLKEKERLQHFIDHERSKAEGLNFFNESFPKRLEVFNKLDNLKEIKKEFQDLLKVIDKIYHAAFYPNSFVTGERENDKLYQANRKLENQILSTYHWENDFNIKQQINNEVRVKIIERLKVIQKFNPFKEIILKVVPIKKGCWPHSSTERKFVDEWDIYYTEKPDISKTVNLKANRSLYRIGTFNHMDYMFLFPSVFLTPFGFDHMYQVVEHFEKLVEEWEKRNKRTFLQKYSKKYDPKRSKFVSRYKLEGHESENFIYWNFHQMKPFENEIKELTRKAENLAREEMKIPQVNKGWVSETKLYQQIKNHIKNRKVIQHARLAFLGKQHLDIFIPSLKVAIEYQGLQHDQPVEFFGGVEAFRKTQERDERKRKLCEENGVTLFYVREGYVLKDVIQQILSQKCE